MPAIHLAHLKIQSASLVQYFDDPQAFLRQLHDLFDQYADRTHRPGKAGNPPPLLSAYHVARPVLVQVAIDLIPFIYENPQAALELANALWSEPVVECRLLAINVLGKVPSSHAKQVIQRISEWIKPNLEEQLWRYCLNEGLSIVRNELPMLYKELVSEWCRTENPFYQRLGLVALERFILNSDFSDFPWVFRILSSFIRSLSPALRPDLANLFCILAKRIPKEVVYFLKDQLSLVSRDANTLWLVHKVTRCLPTEFLEELRNAAYEER